MAGWPTGIEPASADYQAAALPLSYDHHGDRLTRAINPSSTPFPTLRRRTHDMAPGRGGLVRAVRPTCDQVAWARGLRHNLALHTRRDRGRNPREGALERGASPQETPPEGEPRLHCAAYGLDGLSRRDPRSPPMTAPVATPARPNRGSPQEEPQSAVGPPMYKRPSGMPSSRPPRTAPSTRYVPEPKPAFVGPFLGSDRGGWPRTSPFHKEACDALSAIDGA